jgi:hypothetical protein
MAYKVAMVISAAVSAVTGTALIANTVAATAQVGVMGGLTAAWVELNAIMDANPIMIVVLAIAALVAAFVLAYNHIKWFRDMVDAVWAWMKTAASDVTNWIITAWGNVVKFVTKLPGVLANAGKGMWDWLKQGFQDVIAWVMGAWNFLLSKMNVDVGPIHIHPGASLRFSQAAITNERYGRSSVRAVGGGRGTPPILVGQKAAGGLTSTTGPYLVGERGPEVVSLPQGAYVTPNNQLGAGGAQTIVIYNVLDGRKISQSVIRQGLLQQSRGG